jgi:RNA polymerase sigma factor (sigma-70 family)
MECATLALSKAMSPPRTPTDEDLLASDDPEAFGAFYDRHVKTLLGYFMRRTADPEVAADLAAETFASAIVAKSRFRATGTPAIAWLFTIAQRRLADYQRRGYVEQRMRRSLRMERRAIGAEDAALIRMLADDSATALLAVLGPDQRDAVAGHVVEDRSYRELAVALDVSEATVRQRVSRGLATLRRSRGGRG